jgi:hypothetical protein
MTNIQDLKTLVRKVVTKAPSAEFSHEDMREALHKEIQLLIPKHDMINSYRRNKLVLFELIQEAVDAVLPNKVIDVLGQFAEIKQFGQGQKPVFKVKTGRQRAKTFITKAAQAGVYETFRLDSRTFEVPTFTYGGAAVIELEELLDGLVDFSELSDIVMEGLEEAVYREVQLALMNAISKLPARNKFTAAGFMADRTAQLIQDISVYGSGATIFCGPHFASQIVPANGFVSDVDRGEMRNQGYIGKFAGADIVVLPNSFVDEKNEELVLNPAIAFVVPNGGSADEKIVRVAFEGQTIVDDRQNVDWSTEIQAYKKFGTSVLFTNYYGVIENTAISGYGWDNWSGYTNPNFGTPVV